MRRTKFTDLKKVKFTGIVWDTEGEEVQLPSVVILDVDADADMDEDGADILSDNYAWCVLSFKWELV